MGRQWWHEKEPSPKMVYHRADESRRARRSDSRRNSPSGQRQRRRRPEDDFRRPHNGHDYDDRRPAKRRKRSRSRSRDSRSYSGRRSSSSSIDDEVGHFHGRRGDTIDSRYEILEEVGKGTFGKVFRCKDSKYNDQVAVKMVRSVKRYVSSAKIEAAILDKIFDKQQERHTALCVKMYSHFHIQGHYAMVFEVLGLSLYDIVKRNDYARLPVDLVRAVGRQLMQALEFLQSIKLVHTDLKLENVLFVHSSMRTVTVEQRGKTYSISVPTNSRIKLIDFGGATWEDDDDKSRIINTRQYRGPEVILELPWLYPSDIWSAACIIAEIFSGDLLFQTHDELEHLALIEKLCGPIPSHMIEACSSSRKYFDRNGAVKTDELSRSSTKHVQSALSLQDFFLLSEADRGCGVVELVRAMLAVDPSRRITATEALAFPFLQPTG